MIIAISRSQVLIFTPDVTHVDNEPADKLNWSILGNPVSDQLVLNLDLNIGSEIQFQVIASSGAISSIGGQLSGKGRQTIDVSSLPAGTYFLQLSHDNQMEQQAFIIAR